MKELLDIGHILFLHEGGKLENHTKNNIVTPMFKKYDIDTEKSFATFELMYKFIFDNSNKSYHDFSTTLLSQIRNIKNPSNSFEDTKSEIPGKGSMYEKEITGVIRKLFL